ncbi:Chitin synthase-like protein [Emericellopsis cladophorae]|uniref:chitin synthase n=1 Tax=Emericellopsis cladophorae TaxID=2686198 RepID=A0A9P9XZ91_9HYPO|nr:Chitin synthase-like protein [Emericellopsis cladophorae]KAI6780445.1 Chitin synthase-like protein [Emericellopsis cladophorae]
MSNRMSLFSMTSESQRPQGSGPQTAQVSTTTLLNSVHNIYLSSRPHELEASTSLVVNTWLTAVQHGPTVDSSLAARAWEHARRRAEDGCVVLGSLHESTPSVLVPFLSSFPFTVPSSVFKGLEVVRPFIRCVTPHNPSLPREVALNVSLTLSLTGHFAGASISLSQGGLDTERGLLNVPQTAGYRAFDVFYYLLTAASTPAEREFLGLKHPSHYVLLARSGTYDNPSFLPTADDAAAADDFRQALKDVGIKGAAHRNFISTLAGLLKLGNTLDYSLDGDALEEICEDVGGLLGMEPDVLLNQCSTEDRRTLVGGLYESLVDWVISKANETISAQVTRIRDGEEALDSQTSVCSIDENEDTVSITVVEVPEPTLGKALAMRSVFDDTQGINAEIIQDGLEVPPAGSSVLREMQQVVAEVAPDLGIMTGPDGRQRHLELEKREVVLEKMAYAADEDAFVKKLLFPVDGEGINLGRAGRFDLPNLLASSRVWYHLSIHPTDDDPAKIATLPSATSAWSAGVVSRQLRSWRLPEWANRRNRALDFTADFDADEFVKRYGSLGCQDGRDGIESWMLERGWSNGEIFIGKERVWIREGAWWEAESTLDLQPMEDQPALENPFNTGFDTGYSNNGSGYFPHPPVNDNVFADSNFQLGHGRNMSQGNLSSITRSQHPYGAPSVAPTAARNNAHAGDYGLGNKGDTYKGDVFYNEAGEFTGMVDPELAKNKKFETKELPLRRRVWATLVWCLTWWIPSFMLRFIGRMKRPDVRMAWREKLVIFFLIALLNAAIVFWIVGLGQLLCPNFDKAWNRKEVATHQGEKDFWVSHHGKVMMPLAGFDMDRYIVPPLSLACPGLDIGKTTTLLTNATNSPEYGFAVHTSGAMSPYHDSALSNQDWYNTNFKPAIKEFYKGDLVYSTSKVKSEGQNEQHMWARYDERIFDLTDYFYTLDRQPGVDTYQFLNEKITDIFADNPGENIKKLVDVVLDEARASTNETERANILYTWDCIDNMFYKGRTDFRESPRCTVNNWFLLAFAIIMCAVILVKFVAALQFGSKRRPAAQDKFVICQVPAYTEGEDSLRKAVDSLTALQYDNKRKLICVICDGVIVGQGNDRPTPKIVLDILGVDPKVDPPALPFKSVGPGSDQLNYGKVYSGLYEYEGNVVPYMVVVKVGKESEQAKAKPGNRGKRDSQILLMSFLNRVHHRAPMSPLELEMFHQINNIIGVDPELYEYLFMVDADTSVAEDSLTRLVAACSNNAKIAGICGETSLENDEKSWWTMIQVYEYFISHHLSKAFESLFGSVTCLPGCFCMYRLRTADKGKPLIISDAVINEYSVCDVDTLHKKNLLSLGEDRYLTTLMTKHFPFMSFKFVASAQCKTAAPESWSVLLSQRRRWINSTIHNLAELMRLKEMCGFCCFGMRFVVFVDLFGTIILPSTCVYLAYLIYRVASSTGPFPIITLIMLAAVYGLQALIFILKRQWQHIGWMIIYLLAFPIYSFILPVYSFWNMDNFSWGNTRIVIGEKGTKQVVAVEDETFDPRSIPLQRWDDYAATNNLPGRRGHREESSAIDQYEMDEMKSVYSAGPQGSMLTGIPARNTFMPPQSPAAFGAHTRAPTTMSNYQDQPLMQNRQSMMSLGTGIHDINRHQSPYQDYPGAQGTSPSIRASTVMGYGGGGRRSPMVPEAMQSTPSFDFQRGNSGPDDAMIVECIQTTMRDVDLDSVTKKQLRALVEQRLGTDLVGERRTFLDRQIDNELQKL